MRARLPTILALVLPLVACAAQPPAPLAAAPAPALAAAALPAPPSAVPPVASSVTSPVTSSVTSPVTSSVTSPVTSSPATPTPAQGTPSAHAAAPARPADAAAALPATPRPSSTPASATASDAAPPAAVPSGVTAPNPTVPGSVAPAPAMMPSGSATGSLLQTLLALMLVLAVLGGLAWFLKRYGPKGGGANANVRMVGSLNLGGRERVLVVEVGGQWIVLGASPGRINALATMPRQEGVEGSATLAHHAGQAPGANSFADWLKQTIDKRK